MLIPLQRVVFYTSTLTRRYKSASTKRHPKGGTPMNKTRAMPLDFNAGPMVWIDCEMTGLNPRRDKLLEIAVLITNGKLELVDEGVQYIIRTDKAALDGMDEWCTNQHGKSGLTAACLTSKHSKEFVSQQVLAYIKRWIPTQRIGVLAGNSVHLDKLFLAEEMPEIVDWLHYRIVDVSSIKELHRRWYPDNPMPRSAESNHRALDDIKGSIRELQWYRDNIFIKPDLMPKPSGPSPNAPDAIRRIS